MSAQPEVWRVSTPEGVFETDLETLKQWILEGCVLPTDKVTKGNLSWIEAGRVPKLKGAFNGEVSPVSEPPVSNSFAGFADSTSSKSASHSAPATGSFQVVAPANTTTTCQNHPDAAPDYVCRKCG